ncbi:MAG: hypothetical protein AAFX93_07335 [Verrucomicrobiota bacterium]
MPSKTLQAGGLVVAKALSGENHLRLHVLSAEHGRLVCLWRRTQKMGGSGPDLFDQTDFKLEASSGGQTWFVKEYQLQYRHTGIAKRYRSLEQATRLGSFLWQNMLHAEFFEPMAQLANEAFHAFETLPLPYCIYLKSVYRFAREEGYPVRQQWMTHLPQRERETAHDIIHKPLGEQSEHAESESQELTVKLERWLRSETDIIVP